MGLSQAQFRSSSKRIVRGSGNLPGGAVSEILAKESLYKLTSVQRVDIKHAPQVDHQKMSEETHLGVETASRLKKTHTSTSYLS